MGRDPFSPERLTAEAVRERLREAVEKVGGQRAFSRLYGFSAAYVNDVLHGRRDPAHNICAALGIKRKITYTIEYRMPATKTFR